MSRRPAILLIGGGGHASVIADILLEQNRIIEAVISPEDIADRDVFEGLLHLKDDNDVLNYSPSSVKLVNGIGMTPRSNLRQKVNEYFLSKRYQFESVIAKNASVSRYAKLGTAVQVFPNAVIQAGARIANHTIINTAAVVEHNCSIGEYNHIAPGSVLCGQVASGRDVYVGANSTVIQNIRLQNHVIVGAGAIVTKDMLENEICYPCRTVVKSPARIL